MNTILYHIAGPSGSGKTTLQKRISQEIQGVICKDLDDFDNEASNTLGLNSVHRRTWSEDSYIKLANKREELMNNFVLNSELPVIFVGNNREGRIVIDVPAKNKYLLDIDAETSAKRAYERSQKESLEHRRDIKDLQFDIKEAQETIEFYSSQGYVRKNAEDIISEIKNLSKTF